MHISSTRRFRQRAGGLTVQNGPMTDPNGNSTVATGETALAFLRENGIPDPEIERATIDRSLPFVVLETLFRGGVIRYTTRELADRVAQTEAVVVRVRRALGFADADPEELVGTDDDVQAIRRLFDGVQGQSLSVALETVRTSASAMERLADSIAAAFGEGVGRMLDAGADPLVVADAALAENTPAGIVSMLTHVLRHELAGALHRERMSRLSAADLPANAATEMAVGFVDLVGMTETMEFLESDEIVKLVARYEAVAYDEIVRHGGRVVKMLGDGVMFTAPTADEGATICSAVVDLAGRKNGVPPARGGVAWGPVIRSRGDIYGPTVNRAARLCDVAPVGRVLVSSEAAERINCIASAPAGERRLKGIGVIAVFVLDPQ